MRIYGTKLKWRKDVISCPNPARFFFAVFQTRMLIYESEERAFNGGVTILLMRTCWENEPLRWKNKPVLYNGSDGRLDWRLESSIGGSTPSPMLCKALINSGYNKVGSMSPILCRIQQPLKSMTLKESRFKLQPNESPCDLDLYDFAMLGSLIGDSRVKRCCHRHTAVLDEKCLSTRKH